MKNEKGKDVGNVKKPLYKKGWFWIVIICLLFVAMGGNDGKNDDLAKNNTPSMTAGEQGETDPENLETAIYNAIVSAIDEDALETYNYLPENNFSLIKFRGSNNLTNNMVIKGMYLDIFNILKAIQPLIDTDVDFNVIFPLSDKYGNSSDEIVIKATFTNETIKKINFENALSEDTPKMADEWWNHPAANLSK